MLKNQFCPIFDFDKLFAVISKVHMFEVTHFWIDVLGAGDGVTRHTSRFEFEFHWIGRKLMIRVNMVVRRRKLTIRAEMVVRRPMIAIWLTLVL